MRIAFGQQAQEIADMAKTRQRHGAFHQPRRARTRLFKLVETQMLLQPRPPDNIDMVALLQQRLQPARTPAP